MQTKSAKSASVYASIVLYHPEGDQVECLLKTILHQVNHVLLIDNGGCTDAATLERYRQFQPQVTYLPQKRNLGISAAHNLAIEQARTCGQTHLLMLDQDSEPATDMVAKLLLMEARLLNEGKEIGALGPVFFDPRNQTASPFIRCENWRILKTICIPGRDAAIEADYLITSGALVRLDVFQRVGGLDESYFIDYVDIEWGLRARARGYQSYGVGGATMLHRIGDNPLYLPLIDHPIPVHSPLRHYYHFRNALRLYRRDYAPFKWVVNDAYRLVLKFVVYSLFVRNRATHFVMMVLGVWHGLRGRGGPLE